jgi:hypothetical protein
VDYPRNSTHRATSGAIPGLLKCSQRDGGGELVQFGVALPPGQARQLRQKLIDAMSHDAAVLKQKKHITPKSFTFFNVLELLSIIQVVLRRGSCATNI